MTKSPVIGGDGGRQRRKATYLFGGPRLRIIISRGCIFGSPILIFAETPIIFLGS